MNVGTTAAARGKNLSWGTWSFYPPETSSNEGPVQNCQTSTLVLSQSSTSSATASWLTSWICPSGSACTMSSPSPPWSHGRATPRNENTSTSNKTTPDMKSKQFLITRVPGKIVFI